jgi:23S rRNA pseudouridine2605 synthase
MRQRLQKIMAQAGIASRRKCEEIIIDGKVRVNGKIITIGDSADPHIDKITVFNKPLEKPSKKIYLLMNKPNGAITTVSDMYDRKTVMHLLPPKYLNAHLFPIGRLDRDSEGLLLFTNDGDFANKVMHPSHEVQKTYRAWLDRPFSREAKQKLENGTKLKDGYVKGVKIFAVNKKCVDIRLHVGKNKIVKRLFNEVDYHVDRLSRVKIGDLTLGVLKPGAIQELDEVQKDKVFVKDTKNYVQHQKGDSKPPSASYRSKEAKFARSRENAKRSRDESRKPIRSKSTDRGKNGWSRESKPRSSSSREKSSRSRDDDRKPSRFNSASKEESEKPRTSYSRNSDSKSTRFKTTDRKEGSRDYKPRAPRPSYSRDGDNKPTRFKSTDRTERSREYKTRAPRPSYSKDSGRSSGDRDYKPRTARTSYSRDSDKSSGRRDRSSDSRSRSSKPSSSRGKNSASPNAGRRNRKSSERSRDAAIRPAKSLPAKDKPCRRRRSSGTRKTRKF